MLHRIVDALAPGPADTVVEIGPGRGALTELLARRAGRVIAVELDRALARQLAERYHEYAGNVDVVQGDVLRTDLGALAGAGYLLAGNVPYYITTPILFHALEGVLPHRAVFLVQREVAVRAAAPPGSRSYGALSVNLQAATRVERLFDVPAGAFRPPPRVESSLMRITPLEQPLVGDAERGPFRRFVQAVFGQRRKQLGSALRAAAAGAAEAERALAAAGIDPSLRAERLDPADFVRLFRALRERER